MTLEQSTLLQGSINKTENFKEGNNYNVGILFDYIQDETSSVEASITDNDYEDFSNFIEQESAADEEYLLGVDV